LIVVDASLVCDFILDAAANPSLTDFIASQDRLIAPALIEYEVGSVLRRLNLAATLSDERAQDSLQAFQNLRIELYDGRLLMSLAWTMRKNISFYDACYVALAERLSIPLYTMDRKLAATQGHKAKIICRS
jgi:predicted nucleic acid-binding protein